MHEVTPKLVTMAVRMVMTMFRILLQSCLFSMMFLFLSECLVFQAIVIQTTEGRKDLGCIAVLTKFSSIKSLKQFVIQSVSEESR